MKISNTLPCAALALCAMIACSALAQQNDSATPPMESNAPTTAMSQPQGTMTKDQLKQQRKQQKRNEAAANATAKAARAQAALDKADAKSKHANDQQLQAQEKAGQVTAVPAPADQPPPAQVSAPAAPPL
jgi:hypothetical protein